MIKAINIVGLIITSVSYIYIYALGAKPLFLILFIILNLIFLFYLFKINIKDWKKLISFFLIVAIGTLLFIYENGTDFIISRWVSNEYYLNNQLNIILLITFMSFVVLQFGLQFSPYSLNDQIARIHNSNLKVAEFRK